ncbi:MAG: hypothetical protein HYZ90_03960 [Candidatus Omnitrophica bacterium]|nr:hypothetical protein [Candidatus Omnitrophota bacterium]
MKGIGGFSLWLLVLMGTAIFSANPSEAEDEKPRFEGAAYFGGPGNQGARFIADASGPWCMGAAQRGNHLVLTFLDQYNSLNPQTRVICCPLDSKSPIWSFRWPNDPNIQNQEPLYGAAWAPDGLYFVGQSKVAVVNRYGVWARRGVLVKYPLNGPTGQDVGKSLWVVRPSFFPSINGTESLMDVVAVAEEGSLFLYATGYAEANLKNVTSLLAKFDANGNLIWSKPLGETSDGHFSCGLHLAAMNGAVYVAGTLQPKTPAEQIDWRGNTRAALWKVDPAGNLLWTRSSTELVASAWHGNLAASGGHLYLVTTLKAGSKGGLDLIVMKYDQGGNRLWAREWGTVKSDVGRAISVDGNRLYVVGGTDKDSQIEARDALLLQMDAGTGEVLSELTYGGVRDDIAQVVGVSGKKVFVAGDTRSFTENGNQMDAQDVMLLGYSLEPKISLIIVPVDIKPGEKAPNPINLKSKGKIPVAILSTQEFNAPAVADRGSLTFGRTGQEQSLASNTCGIEDVNKDGLMDLVAHFENALTGFQAEDLNGILRGKTLKGVPFQGMDLIRVVPPTASAPLPPPRLEKPVTPPKMGTKESSPPAKGSMNIPHQEVERMKKEGGVAY